MTPEEFRAKYKQLEPELQDIHQSKDRLPRVIGGYRAKADATPDEVLAEVGARISGTIADLMDHPDGPLAAAYERGDAFLLGWWGEPPGPAFAPEDGSGA